eukprot:TRINITY_DN7138_c0_g1_i1.p1 TRINITY_DN7138_c0_g1~~TRINITY_DN7138_c0_g1_i1.p1  ORF type:complete len:241 (-),score=75.63 TRINITY_DN7138_c0_g1_i1:106-804(-)
MKVISIVVALVLVCAVAMVHADGDAPVELPVFEARAFFEGHWTSDNFISSAAQVGEAEALRFEINDNNSTLAGSFVNPEGETVQLRIEFDEEKNNAGAVFVFTDDIDDLEDEDTPLFNFEFTPTSIGVYTSSGAWNGESKGSYHMIATSPRSFVLNIFKSEIANGVVTTSIAVKEASQEPKTFFQQYGTMIMMVGFVLVSQVLKRTVGQPAATEAATQAGAAAGAAANLKSE